MNKLTIKGAFADEISRLLHHSTSKPSYQLSIKEITVTNDNSKEEIAELFRTCKGFEILSDCDECGNDDEAYIEFIVERPQEEIDKAHTKFEADRLNHIKYCIARLKKWSDNKVEDKEQIKTYLLAKKLDWILEEIEK